MSLSLDDELVEELKKAAAEAGVPLDDVARQALSEFLQVERRRRVVERGRAELKAGRVVDGEAMERWLDSWGTDDETDPPSCRD